MLGQMRGALGWGEPNAIHRWYGSRNGAYYSKGSTPWCQMTITWAAWHSGHYSAVCPNGDRAYTVWGAEDGAQLGRWHNGTADNIKRYAEPGAIVYMDWDGHDGIPPVDHVGIVEKNLGDGRVITIEGNTGDACKRRVRGASVIAGFWNPDYSKGSDMTGDALYKSVWESDRMPVPYGSATNREWKPASVLVDHGVQLRKILAAVEVQNATITALAQALAERDQAVDVDALVGRIREEIERVTVRLDVTDAPQP